MIATDIISEGKFLRMSMTAQALYMHLLANADDDGIVDAFTIMRMVGAKEDDLVLLKEREYITVLDPHEFILWITNWQDFNRIVSNMKEDSKYLPLLRSVVKGVKIVRSTKKEDNERRYKQLKEQRESLKQGSNDPNRINPGSFSDSLPDPRRNIDKDRTGKNSTTPLTPQGELAISPEVRVLWDAWEQNLGPVTRNQGFHRNALSGLLKAHGSERVQQMIRAAAAAHADRYAPKDAKPTNPKQLQEKWDALYLWAKGKAHQQETSKPVRI